MSETHGSLADADRVRLAATFERGADGYDRARPNFPDAALDFVLPADARRVLDLGAGTGKVTDSLVARGLDVVAIDPSPAMLAKLSARLPSVDTRIGTAEATGLTAASVDAVTVGSAFHWFARPAADAEIARVLRPGGHVGLMWNRRDPDSFMADLVEALQLRRDRPRPEDNAAMVLDTTWFGPTERRDFPHVQTTTADGVAELIGSRSYVLDLPQSERDAVLQSVRDWLATDPRTRGRDRLDLAYRTLVLRAAKR